MKRGIAKTNLYYNNQYYAQGDHIEFDDQDLDILFIYVENVEDIKTPKPTPAEIVQAEAEEAASVMEKQTKGKTKAKEA